MTSSYLRNLLPNAADNPEEIPQMAAPVTMSGKVDPHDTLTMPLGPPTPEVGMDGVTESPKMAKSSPLDEQESGMQDQLAKMAPKPYEGDHPRVHSILNGLKTAGNIAGDVFAPGTMALIPGTQLHNDIEKRGLEKGIQGIEQEKSKEGLEQAQTGEANAKATAAANPQPKEGLTPEETTIHDLMTGENGQPRINPKTQQPYSYLEAYQAVNQAKQDVKPPNPEVKTDKVTRVVNGVPHTFLINATTGEDVKDEGQTKLAGDGGKADARSDRSYQYSTTRLDKERSPIEQTAQRLGRLQDTLRQGSPQADALVAPELLTVMAGGMGSGLRMNEAEISRIVGGRSAWENLKASAQHWSTNPESANSITTDQRQQIHKLVDVVGQKLTQKQAIIDKAEDELLNADDPKEHRRIIAETHKALSAIDSGDSAQAEPQRPANVPAGFVFNANGPKGAGWYKPNATNQ